MPEENPNLEWNLWSADLSAGTILTPENSSIPTEENIVLTQNLNDQVPIDLGTSEQNTNNFETTEQNFEDSEYRSVDNLDVNNTAQIDWIQNIETPNFNGIWLEEISEWSSSIDSNVFLDDWDDNSKIASRPTGDSEWFGKYLRLFFWASVIATLWIIAIILLYSFNTFISKASQTTIDSKYTEYVQQYKDKLWKVKKFLKKNNIDNYNTPNIKDENAKSKVNEIINATDIDYIEKKDLLNPFVSELARDSESWVDQIETIKQDIARQWFLPEEISNILSEEQAIDTIQRSMNALEVIKFSTATKVFSFMDSALITISDMLRVAGSSAEAIGNLLNQVSSRWEKDINAYVYMCYLNPFETNANCDTIWDFDLYYNNIIKDDTLNTRLFKNTMNAINQILEKEDSSLFSITFNWFNAQDKDITFSIEVYTNQNDERNLIAKWKKNPNIFILTNIINLLKQSSFIIWADIFTKEIQIETRTITLWWISTKVNYSNMDFTVPLQKNTEREIFDYIDLDNLQKLLATLKHNPEDDNINTSEDINTIESNIEPWENNESDLSEVNDEFKINDETNEDSDNNENQAESQDGTWDSTDEEIQQ